MSKTIGFFIFIIVSFAFINTVLCYSIKNQIEFKLKNVDITDTIDKNNSSTDYVDDYIDEDEDVSDFSEEDFEEDDNYYSNKISDDLKKISHRSIILARQEMPLVRAYLERYKELLPETIDGYFLWK